MQQYYESYRASVMRDILPQFSEHATNIKTPAGETFYNHLKKITNNITNSMQSNDEKGFLRWLKSHQKAVIDLMGLVVKSKGDPFYEGYKSFKFSNAELHFDNFVAVPRFGLEPKSAKLPVVYASEMSAVIQSKKKQVAKDILAMKVSGTKFILIENGKLTPSSFDDVNQGVVRDWTARLVL